MKILGLMCLLCLPAVACDENVPANALTGESVPVCQTYYLPLGSYSSQALAAFCDSTVDYPVYLRHRNVTDGDAGAGTYVVCCQEGYDTILTFGGQ